MCEVSQAMQEVVAETLETVRLLELIREVVQAQYKKPAEVVHIPKRTSTLPMIPLAVGVK